MFRKKQAPQPFTHLSRENSPTAVAHIIKLKNNGKLTSGRNKKSDLKKTIKLKNREMIPVNSIEYDDSTGRLFELDAGLNSGGNTKQGNFGTIKDTVEILGTNQNGSIIYNEQEFIAKVPKKTKRNLSTGKYNRDPEKDQAFISDAPKEAKIMQDLGYDALYLARAEYKEGCSHAPGTLIMPKFKGENLKTYLESNPSNAEKNACALHLMHAVKFVHDKDFVHFDIKPDNIMFDATADEKEEYPAKLIDFGLTKKTGEEVPKTIGTRPFMDPRLYASSAISSYDKAMLEYENELQQFNGADLIIAFISPEPVKPKREDFPDEFKQQDFKSDQYFDLYSLAITLTDTLFDIKPAGIKIAGPLNPEAHFNYYVEQINITGNDQQKALLFGLMYHEDRLQYLTDDNKKILEDYNQIHSIDDAIQIFENSVADKKNGKRIKTHSPRGQLDHKKAQRQTHKSRTNEIIPKNENSLPQNILNGINNEIERLTTENNAFEEGDSRDLILEDRINKLNEFKQNPHEQENLESELKSLGMNMRNRGWFSLRLNKCMPCFFNNFYRSKGRSNIENLIEYIPKQEI